MSSGYEFNTHTHTQYRDSDPPAQLTVYDLMKHSRERRHTSCVAHSHNNFITVHDFQFGTATQRAFFMEFQKFIPDSGVTRWSKYAWLGTFLVLPAIFGMGLPNTASFLYGPPCPSCSPFRGSMQLFDETDDCYQWFSHLVYCLFVTLWLSPIFLNFEVITVCQVQFVIYLSNLPFAYSWIIHHYTASSFMMNVWWFQFAIMFTFMWGLLTYALFFDSETRARVSWFKRKTHQSSLWTMLSFWTVRPCLAFTHQLLACYPKPAIKLCSKAVLVLAVPHLVFVIDFLCAQTLIMYSLFVIMSTINSYTSTTTAGPGAFPLWKDRCESCDWILVFAGIMCIISISAPLYAAVTYEESVRLLLPFNLLAMLTWYYPLFLDSSIKLKCASICFFACLCTFSRLKLAHPHCSQFSIGAARNCAQRWLKPQGGDAHLNACSRECREERTAARWPKQPRATLGLRL